jgi:hypothetical protein
MQEVEKSGKRTPAREQRMKEAMKREAMASRSGQTGFWGILMPHERRLF